MVDVPNDSPLVSNPKTYIWELVKKANKQGGGFPIVQRFEDFKRMVSTTREGLSKMSFKSTETNLNPGDLTKVFPKEVVIAMIDFINRIDKCIPGFAVNGDLLLHGVEVKPVSFTPETDENMETSIANVFVAGDGVNASHGLLPASAVGLYVALEILKKIASTEKETSEVTKAINNVFDIYKGIIN